MSRTTPSGLLDHHFARFLAARSALEKDDRARFLELVEELSLAMSDGHSCLPVDRHGRDVLGKSPLVSGSGLTPLILDQDRLYLHRYHRYESRLAGQLAALAVRQYNFPSARTLLDDCFGPDLAEPDWQKKAAEVALSKALCIISGGPGTGKTSTVVKIIGLLLQAAEGDLRIALAAPTGKAAMRMQEAIANSIGDTPGGLAFPEAILRKIPTTATTLHRLLGVRRNMPQFRHTGDNPLPWDVLVVDEASMVDLALMSKMVDALKPEARLILLGDKDQLTSVESGAVLPDCIRSLPTNTVELKKSYRFDRGIKSLATAINAGDGEQAWSLLNGDAHANVGLLRNPYFGSIGGKYAAYMEVVDNVARLGMREVFRAFSGFQVLCAARHGARGVQGINAVVENHLKRMGYDCFSDPWYAGRPILITANDYSLELFNGDIGICLPDPADGSMKVWFERGDGTLKSCLPYRIPRCETVYAMTIHKSQGSEFREVVVILPEEESRLLSRQLVYTAVTRAKESVQIVASKKILVYALQSDYPRHSGLSQMLAKQGI
jgi:exodeoxyribonuclease V alpha subunit